jgi:hypothetical protein
MDYHFEENILSDTPLDEWEKLDFVEIINSRIDTGITKSSFEREIKMWQSAIRSLPSYNEKVFRDEIDNMDLNIPTYEIELNELQGIYSRLVAYRTRICKMKSIINAHHEIFSKSYKTLKISAMALFTGTAKDKEASAEQVVQPFFMGTIASKNLLDYLIDVEETIEFTSISLHGLLKEKEVNARINSKHNMEGAYYNFEKNVDEVKSNWDTSDIHTRKKIQS